MLVDPMVDAAVAHVFFRLVDHHHTAAHTVSPRLVHLSRARVLLGTLCGGLTRSCLIGPLIGRFALWKRRQCSLVQIRHTPLQVSRERLKK